MRIRTTGIGAVLAAVTALAIAAAGCGGSSSGGNSGGASGDEGKPQYGGSVVIDRVADSQSMDKTTVFDNESIWVFEQIMEPLYTVTKDGKDVEPWLATSYTLSADKKTYTFKLRPGVKFSNGQPMTSADVKFSIDAARVEDQGWGFLDVAIKDIEAPSPDTVVIHTKYPWSPFLADIALFANAVIPKDYGGETKKQFYEHPVGTGPFMWDHWTKGDELVLKKNPNYWQKGKPYLDSVTWRVVGDDNTRELQLEGGQSQVDEFPPFQTVDKLKSTPGITMTLFPSTRTDYMMMNERVAPLADVHVRRAISLAIDRAAIIKSVLFTYGEPANSFMPPQVPYYDKSTPGLQYDMDQAKQEMAQSKYPNGFDVEMLLGKGSADEHSYGQIIQQSLQQLGINVHFKQVDPSTEFENEQEFKYELGFSYWTMDIADPDELVSFAIDPKGGGAHSFYTDYSNPTVIGLSHQAERETNVAKRAQLYTKLQQIASHDAFLGFLYYSPFRYAYSSKLHGFFVYPLGNYHLEDAWLG